MKTLEVILPKLKTSWNRLNDVMERTKLKTPILFLASNRPAVAKIALEIIRTARPERLYVVSDGTKGISRDEAAKCEEVRLFVREIDWACELRTLFREEHFGYGRGICKGIDWFFEHEDEGIILEDHCLPHPTFFRYCSELLNVYRSDTRVMEISGNNAFHSGTLVQDYSYSFSAFTNNGAWASWKRAWKLCDSEMNLYPIVRKKNLLQYDSLFEQDYFDWVFERAYLFPDSSWEYQWDFAKKVNSGLTIIPQKNLVCLLEDGESLEGTDDGPLSICKPLQFPLVHPPMVMADEVRDNHVFRQQKTSLNTRIKTLIKSMLPLAVRNKMFQVSITKLIESGVSVPEMIEKLNGKCTYGKL
jgi:hypothetical protein